MGIAATVLALIVVAERVDRRIPGALIGLVLSTAAVAVFDLKAHGVGVVGAIHAGLPSLGPPSVHVNDVRNLLGPALTVAFVCVVQTAATARSTAVDSRSPGQFDRDLVALGAGNLLAGLSGTFSVNASPPRTAVIAASGGRSQLTGLIAAAGVVIVLFAAGLLEDLPQATLGALLIFVATKLFGAGELRRVFRFDHVEFALAAITVVVVGLVGIEQGVVVAAVLAVAQRTRLAARPRDAVLGRVPGTDHWIPADVGQTTEQVPGVIVYLLYAPLWYGNATHVAARMRQVLDSASESVHTLVFDADGVSDIDYTAALAFRQLAMELRRQGVAIGVARTSHLVHRNFKHSGLLDDIGANRLFPTVQDAVAALADQP